jgi:hypothetical protein
MFEPSKKSPSLGGTTQLEWLLRIAPFKGAFLWNQNANRPSTINRRPRGAGSEPEVSNPPNESPPNIEKESEREDRRGNTSVEECEILAC